MITVYRLYRRRHNEIKNFFGLSSTLKIPLPIPLLKQQELQHRCLHYENNSGDFITILNDESLSDVVFMSGRDYYYCHKVILCSRVELFRKLFRDCVELVTFTDEVILNKEVLLTTNLFDQASIIQHQNAR